MKVNKVKYKDIFKKHVQAFVKIDKDLKKLVKIHGILDFEPEIKREPFESLVRSVAFQQLHGKAAQTILNRMLAHFPDKKFPSPQDLVGIPAETLRACGYSASKVKAIKDIAEKTTQGVIPSKKLQPKQYPNDITISKTRQSPIPRDNRRMPCHENGNMLIVPDVSTRAVRRFVHTSRGVGRQCD